MKKVITTAALLFTASTFMVAQDAMKPAAGAKNLEVNLTPLGGKPISITNSPHEIHSKNLEWTDH